jgi:hypothetical protein
MATRFLRVGTTVQKQNGGYSTPNVLAPVPAGLDDPQGFSNLNANADSDPIPVGGYDAAEVTLFSDTTCSAGLQVFGGDTQTGPWVAIGSVSANPSLAAPIAVNPFATAKYRFLKVTTSSFVSGNPRANLAAWRIGGTGIL